MHLITEDKDIRVSLTELVTKHFSTHIFNSNNNETLKLWIEQFKSWELSRQLKELTTNYDHPTEDYYNNNSWAHQLSGRNYFLRQKTKTNGIGCVTQRTACATSSNFPESPTNNSWHDTEHNLYFYIGEQGIKLELKLNTDNSISLIPKISTIKGYVYEKRDNTVNLFNNEKNLNTSQSKIEFVEGDIYLNQFYKGEGIFYNCGNLKKIYNKARDFIDRILTPNSIYLEFDNIICNENNFASLELLEKSVKSFK